MTRVERGDIIAEVETDKGVIEVEVFASGVVQALLVSEGTKVPVGTPLARIGDAESMPDAPTAAVSPVPAVVPRGRASPSARQLARELGVDVANVRGSGPAGAVTRQDVESAARGAGATPSAAPSAGVNAAPSAGVSDARERMRQAIAAAMARSNREIPHYYVTHTLCLGPALDWLEKTNAERPVPERLVYGALLLKAVALALTGFPELNARWEDDRLVPSPGIHVAVAISLREGGLVIPAIVDTDQLALGALMAKLTDLVERARRGQLRSSELSSGTVTVTSLGERGVDGVQGVIYPPQTALVGFGTPVVRPWVVDGVVKPMPILQASLAADHRASDGHRGARFLKTVEQLLTEPAKLC